jgi:hypothetical protein
VNNFCPVLCQTVMQVFAAMCIVLLSICANWFWLSLTGMYLSIENYSACNCTPHSCPWKDSRHQYIPKCFTISRRNSHTWNSSCSYWCCHLLCKHQLHCREVGFLLKKFTRNFIVGGLSFVPWISDKIVAVAGSKDMSIVKRSIQVLVPTVSLSNMSF